MQGMEDSSSVCVEEVEVPRDTYCHHHEETSLPSLTREPSHFEVIRSDLKSLEKALPFPEVGFIQADCRSLKIIVQVLVLLAGHEQEQSSHKACLAYIPNGTKLLLKVPIFPTAQWDLVSCRYLYREGVH